MEQLRMLKLLQYALWVVLAILIVMSVWGCTQQQAKPEPRYRVEQRMSPAMESVVMELVWLKSDPNVFKAKEIDPFRRQ